MRVSVMSIFDKYDLLTNQLAIKKTVQAEDTVAHAPGVGS